MSTVSMQLRQECLSFGITERDRIIFEVSILIINVNVKPVASQLLFRGLAPLSKIPDSLQWN